MKNQIICKIENAIERYGMEGYTAEELYLSLKESTGSEFSLLSECYGLTYEEENYVLYSDESDVYSLEYLCTKIRSMMANSFISEELIRESHHIYGYLKFWQDCSEMNEYQMEQMCDCENLFGDSLIYVKMGNYEQALSCMASILSMVVIFN